MKVSFLGLGEVTATFGHEEEEKVTAGKLVKLSSQGIVAPCVDKDSFIGVCTGEDGDCVAIQLRGYADIPMADTGGPTAVGFQKLSSDANGKIKADTAGREYLVLALDNTNKTVGILL